MESIHYGNAVISMMQVYEIRVKEQPNLLFAVRGCICFRMVYEGNELTEWKIMIPSELEEELKKYSEITVYGTKTETFSA